MIGRYSLSGPEARTISSAFWTSNVNHYPVNFMNKEGSYLLHTWQDVRFAFVVSVRSNTKVDFTWVSVCLECF